MTVLAERLRQRFFATEEHPYRTLERVVEERLCPEHALMDAGCGYTAPVLSKFVGKAARLVGVDVVAFDREIPGIELYQADLAQTRLDSDSIDIVISRSVIEHLNDPQAVYREMFRILRPGGVFVFLTANLWDYATIIAKLVPNYWHPWVVAKTEGRDERDVFPVVYRSNSRKQVERLSRCSGFEIESFSYLGQYPNYFMFNAGLFLLATAYAKLTTRFASLRSLRGWILATLRKPKFDQARDQCARM